MTAPVAAAVDLGPCAAPWCDRPAVVYMAGPTYGRSPRLLLIGGQRAAELMQGDPLAVRCLDCVCWAVGDVSGGERWPGGRD